MIKRLKLFRLLLFILALSQANAQFTSVTGTVTDLDSQTWNNGTWQVALYNPLPQSPANINGVPLTSAQLNQHGALSSGGVLTATLADNSIVAPAGTYWVFTLCPNASAQCAIVNSPVSGASQDISSILSTNLKGPRFTANTINGGSFGYSDVEIKPTPNPGGQYFNVSLSCTRFWNGSSWSCFNSGLLAGITALTGDGTATGPGSVPFTLAAVNTGPGTCGDSTHTCQITDNGKGLVTSQSSIAISFPVNGITALSGDLTATGPGSVIGTLITVNSSPGSCGDSTHVCQVITNAKGLTTSQSAIAITNSPIVGSVVDVTASRTSGTNYQNTNPYMIFVSGVYTTSGSSVAEIDCVIGSSSPPTIRVNANQFGATTSGDPAGFSCMVPAGWFYKINIGGSAILTLAGWFETGLN